MLVSVLTPLLLAVSVSACRSSRGQEQVFPASYELVTNRVSALKLNPAAAGSQIPMPGREITPGQSYSYFLPETQQNPTSGTSTTILVTRLDQKTTRVQITTTKLGIISNSRDQQIEKQRLNELSQLLAP